MQLRYLGFDQTRNARVFRFDIIVKGEATKQATVTVDLALFLTHHVGIQDGPTLCATKLSSDLEASVEGDHVLTAEDIRAHAQARSDADAKRAEARRSSYRRPTPPAAYANPRGQA